MEHIVSDNNLIELTADIVSAHLSNNSVATAEVADLIQSVYQALSQTSQPVTDLAPKLEPAVSIRASIKPDYIICLEDGARLKMLKRYLRTHFDMTPEQYREKWGLPRDYPMVAPNYAAQRAELAIQIGLGRKTSAKPAAAAKAPTGIEPTKKARGRISKQTPDAQSDA
jgi:predicted transcriptional regulator